MTPTQLTLRELERLGAVADVVERWIPHTKIKKDLFGFIDIVALLGPNTIGIQTTTATNHSHRRKKILAEPRAKAWLAAGNLIEIHSWSGSGTKAICRKEEIVLEDCIAYEADDEDDE